MLFEAMKIVAHRKQKTVNTKIPKEILTLMIGNKIELVIIVMLVMIIVVKDLLQDLSIERLCQQGLDEKTAKQTVKEKFSLRPKKKVKNIDYLSKEDEWIKAMQNKGETE